MASEKTNIKHENIMELLHELYVSFVSSICCTTQRV